MIKNELPKTELRLSDFYYDLPKEMIAQTYLLLMILKMAIIYPEH